MLIDFKDLSKSQIYFLMTQTLIPRPIAWVLSEHKNGTLNLAPFSYFNGVSSEPPLLMISAGRKRNGSKKDTWSNIEERKNFVVHIPSKADVESITQSAAPFEEGISEIETLGLNTIEFEGSPLPHLSSSKIAFSCTLYQIIELGQKSQALILGQIRSAYIDQTCMHIDGKKITIDSKEIDPLARLGGTLFCGIDTPFET